MIKNNITHLNFCSANFLVHFHYRECIFSMKYYKKQKTISSNQKGLYLVN